MLNVLKPVAQVTAKLIAQIVKGAIATAVLLLLLIWGFQALFTTPAVQTSAQVRNLILGGLQNSSELTTVMSSGKATVVVERPRQLWRLPLGETHLVYEGVGTIRAGMDLQAIEVLSVDEFNHRIQLRLPLPTVNEVRLDVAHSNVLANYRQGLAPRADAEMQTLAEQKALTIIQQEAQETKILTAAQHNAEVIVAEILNKAGYETVEFEPNP